MNALLDFIILLLQITAYSLFCWWMYRCLYLLNILVERIEQQRLEARLPQNSTASSMTAAQVTSAASKAAIKPSTIPASTATTTAPARSAIVTSTTVPALAEKLASLPFGATIDEIKQRIRSLEIKPMNLKLQAVLYERDAAYLQIGSVDDNSWLFFLPSWVTAQRLLSQRTSQQTISECSGLFNFQHADDSESSCTPAIWSHADGQRVRPGRIIVPAADGNSAARAVGAEGHVARQTANAAWDLSQFQQEIEALWTSPRDGSTKDLVDRFEKKWGTHKGRPLPNFPTRAVFDVPEPEQDFSMEPYAIWAIADDQGRWYVIPACSVDRLHSAQTLGRQLINNPNNIWSGWFRFQVENTNFEVLQPATATLLDGGGLQLECSQPGLLRV